MILIDAAGIVATMNRADSLKKTLASISNQAVQPARLIIVDASDDARTQLLCNSHPIVGLRSAIEYRRAERVGAAAQREQGLKETEEPFIWFLDDDIILEAECFERLWHSLELDPELGGVSAMVTNQRYTSPGFISRVVFTLMKGNSEATFAGMVLGPAVNLLPEDNDQLPEITPTEWLNTTCTVYRREALPDPVFDSFFTGYSLMEDLTLSLRVAQRGWKLANARTARIFHDSQSSEQKSNPIARAEMELTNRLYVMRHVLGRQSLADYVKLGLWECWGIISSLGKRPFHNASAALRGKAKALAKVARREAL